MRLLIKSAEPWIVSRVFGQLVVIRQRTCPVCARAGVETAAAATPAAWERKVRLFIAMLHGFAAAQATEDVAELDREDRRRSETRGMNNGPGGTISLQFPRHSHFGE
jgi:hypothetical protein